MHMVHVKEGLSLSEALKQPDGLAVVGIFHRLCKTGNSLAQLETVIDAVVEQSEGFATLDNYSPVVHLPSNSSAFYRYNGSLTTPECQEAVVWTVLAKPQTMTEQQLELLRTVHGSNGEEMETNVRPVQPLNGRKVQLRVWRIFEDYFLLFLILTCDLDSILFGHFFQNSYSKN